MKRLMARRALEKSNMAVQKLENLQGFGSKLSPVISSDASVTELFEVTSQMLRWHHQSDLTGKWLTEAADVFKRESYVIRVWKSFSFARRLPPFPTNRSLFPHLTSASPVTRFNSYLMDVRGTVCTCTNQNWQMQRRPYCTFSGPASRTISDSSTEGADVYDIQNCTRPDAVYQPSPSSIHRRDGLTQRSKFIVPPGPSHLTTRHWPSPPDPEPPLQTPLVIQYAQTEPFDPAAPLGITRSLWKWKGLQSKGLCTFCASKPQILYLETFKSGLLFLSYLGF